MKKIFSSILTLAMAVLTFTACEDVPAPYNIPGNGNNNSGSATEGEYLNETFTSGLGDFEVKTIKGTPWVYDSHNYVVGTGYDSSNQTTTPSESWLISPDIDLTASTGAYIEFMYIYRYNRTGTVNKIYITDSYTGDPATTTWTDITGTLVEGSDWQTWSEYKQNVPTQFIGKKNVKLAFYYACGNSSATFEMKNLVVKEGKVEETPVEPETPDVITPVNGTYINESFSSKFGVFELKNIKGTPWMIDFQTAKASGYDNASKVTTESESYLVSKPMNMTTTTTAATVAFEYILRYVTNNGTAVPGIANKVLITDSYTGDPATTTWTDITGALVEGTDWNTFQKYSAAVPAQFLGKSKVVIALYYACSAASSGTWEVKNLTVKEGKGGGDEPGGGDEGDLTATNGDFEAWVDGKPNNWKTASTAGNASLSQSTDAHSGKYSVCVAGTSSANKRIGYKETTLKAGDYTMTFYTKAATANGASVRPGYVQVTDGKVGQYMYGEYTNDISSTEWIQVTHTFNIPAEGTYCLVIMNSKNPGGDVLIDDFKLTMGSETIIK